MSSCRTQRFAGDESPKITKKSIPGTWEVVRLTEPTYERQLEAGQILWGEGELNEEEWNNSFLVRFEKGGTAGDKGSWSFNEKEQALELRIDNETISYLHTFAGQDWENQTQTLLFTGLDSNGRAVWGKRVE